MSNAKERQQKAHSRTAHLAPVCCHFKMPLFHKDLDVIFGQYIAMNCLFRRLLQFKR